MLKPIALILLFGMTICFGFFIESQESNTRIVGGQDAMEGQFPWMVSIRTREDDQHQCGGSILNSKWILTAAHCFYFNNATENHIIIAGSTFLSSGGITYNLSRIIAHEDFLPVAVKNDVAVVEVVGEIEFTEFMQPIKLSTEFVDEVDSVLSGWGRLYFAGPLPDNLQYMNVKTLSLEKCREYPLFYPDMFVSDDEICTMSIPDELGFCNGDSGGPLVADGKQIGIASWANPPCAFGLPDVYMRVSSFVEWINKAIST